MELAAQLKRGISRQFSTGSLRKSGRFSFRRQPSLDPQGKNIRFSFGRQSSLDPVRRAIPEDALTVVPDNLDATMQLLFMACKGDVKGIQDLLDEGTDVNSIDLDGRTALHIAACEGHVDVVKLLLSRKANLDARDRWGSTAAADAKHYGNMDVYQVLKARGAKTPKTRKTPMAVTNPKEVPEYELNPFELQVRKADGIAKGVYQVAKWNGTKVAVKILDKESYTDPEIINAFKSELTLMEKVRHPNIILQIQESAMEEDETPANSGISLSPEKIEAFDSTLGHHMRANHLDTIAISDIDSLVNAGQANNYKRPEIRTLLERLQADNRLMIVDDMVHMM